MKVSKLQSNLTCQKTPMSLEKVYRNGLLTFSDHAQTLDSLPFKLEREISF
jgi:hypothetical protein